MAGATLSAVVKNKLNPRIFGFYGLEMGVSRKRV